MPGVFIKICNKKSIIQIHLAPAAAVAWVSSARTCVSPICMHSNDFLSSLCASVYAKERPLYLRNHFENIYPQTASWDPKHPRSSRTTRLGIAFDICYAAMLMPPNQARKASEEKKEKTLNFEQKQFLFLFHFFAFAFCPFSLHALLLFFLVSVAWLRSEFPLSHQFIFFRLVHSASMLSLSTQDQKFKLNLSNGAEWMKSSKKHVEITKRCRPRHKHHFKVLSSSEMECAVLAVHRKRHGSSEYAHEPFAMFNDKIIKCIGSRVCPTRPLQLEISRELSCQ